jgi:uncharacterized protein
LKKTIMAMGMVVVILAVLALLGGGVPLLWEGLLAGLNMFRNATVLLLAAFAISGLAQVLINPAKVSALLGKDAGWKGLAIGMLAGTVIPGGPYVYYPISASLLAAGADASIIIVFLVSKGLWDISRTPMEIAIMGPRVTAVRFAVTLAFPLVAGVLARLLYPGLTDKLALVKKEAEKP